MNSLKLKKIPTLAFLLIFLIACSDDETSESNPAKSKVEVRLTDSPANYSEINVDIREVQVQNNGWINLTTQTGIYNLLDFRNGIDTLIASDSIPSGRINQVRLILGDSNSIVVDGVEYPLTIPSGSQSGLKLLVNDDLIPNITYSLLLDFDAAKSIVKTGNGEYKLKPVIKVITEGIDGGIEGHLNPNTVPTMIYALNGADTAGGAIADSLGYFLINGLDSGTYNVIINPQTPYKKDTIQSNTVNNGSILNLGTINLTQ
ncbi:MAG: DUF4382 domain-containing protein [Vicingaceae bacterium]